MELGLLSFTKGAPLLELVVEPNMPSHPSSIVVHFHVFFALLSVHPSQCSHFGLGLSLPFPPFWKRRRGQKKK
jgi:hypothetical protein